MSKLDEATGAANAISEAADQIAQQVIDLQQTIEEIVSVAEEAGFEGSVARGQAVIGQLEESSQMIAGFSSHMLDTSTSIAGMAPE